MPEGWVTCAGCGEEVVRTLGAMVKHDAKCEWHSLVKGQRCTHAGYCYRREEIGGSS